MALHNDDFVRPFGPALDRDRIADQRGRGDAATVGLDHLADGQHLEAPAALRADPPELLQPPIDRRADPALGIGLRGQRVARAEAYELFDVGLEALLRDFVSRVGSRRFLGSKRGGHEGGEQKSAFHHAPCLPSPLRRRKTSRSAPPECARSQVRR